MDDRHPTSCPVCDGSAWEEMPHDSDAEVISCASCGQFRISGSALETMKHVDADTRRGKLEDAKRAARPGALPFIPGF